MKKLILNLSDSTYEKLRFEAILMKKSVPERIADRLMYLEFDDKVEAAYDEWLSLEIKKI